MINAPLVMPSRLPKESAGPPIRMCGLHRWFGDTHAVNNISFEVHGGEVFGYIGPNGAGKTTSMRILSTLDEPSAGDAFVDGFSVIEDPERVRSRLGFMPDYFGTYQNVNVKEYLDFFARAYGLRGAERRGAVAYAMDFTGLGPLELKPINGLSKGMKQRLCLGRTMIHDPSVMVLDEPAAGLDPRARIELREMIARLADLGKAVLISSHILTELAEICDRVGIIEHGRLVAVGTVDEISKHADEKKTVRVRLISDPSACRDWLMARDDIFEARMTNDGVVFTHTAEHETHNERLATLLAELLNAGHRVVEYAPQSKSLEDVFLHVTTGRTE